MYKMDSKKTVGKKFIYSLTGIISHTKSKSFDDSMYTAVVKKRKDGQKDKVWLSFNKDQMKEISEE